MFKCEQCPSVFIAKRNLTTHQNKHVGVRFPYTVCEKSFISKSNLKRHLKTFMGFVNVPLYLRPIPAPFADPVQRGYLQIVSGIIVPDVPAGPLNVVSDELYFDDDDDICMAALDEYENRDLADIITVQQIATRRFEMQETGELKNYTEAFNLDMVQPSPSRYSMLPKYNNTTAYGHIGYNEFTKRKLNLISSLQDNSHKLKNKLSIDDLEKSENSYNPDDISHTFNRIQKKFVVNNENYMSYLVRMKKLGYVGFFKNYHSFLYQIRKNNYFVERQYFIDMDIHTESFEAVNLEEIKPIEI